MARALLLDRARGSPPRRTARAAGTAARGRAPSDRPSRRRRSPVDEAQVALLELERHLQACPTRRASPIHCSRSANGMVANVPASIVSRPRRRAASAGAPLALERAVERAAIDAEDLGGALLVAAGLAQDELDVAALELGQRRAIVDEAAGGARAGAARAPRDLGRQIRRQDDAVLGQRERALDDVLQLAHVAGPARSRCSSASASGAIAGVGAPLARARTWRGSARPAAGCRSAARAAAAAGW